MFITIDVINNNTGSTYLLLAWADQWGDYRNLQFFCIN